MSDYNPSALLRLSMSLKQIRPMGNDPVALHDLHQAARILEGLSCLPDPEAMVGDAIEHASQTRDIISQRKTEAVIENRIREGLWAAALKIGKRGFPEGHPIEVAQASVCHGLLQARRVADPKERQAAYDQAEAALQELRHQLRKTVVSAPGEINAALRDAARGWLTGDRRDGAGFNRYLANAAGATHHHTIVDGPRRTGMQPA